MEQAHPGGGTRTRRKSRSGTDPCGFDREGSRQSVMPWEDNRVEPRVGDAAVATRQRWHAHNGYPRAIPVADDLRPVTAGLVVHLP